MSAVVGFFSSLFIAIAQVKALADYANAFAATIMAWYANNAKNDQAAALNDAVALSTSATTEEEFFAASKAWQKALAMPRVLK